MFKWVLFINHNSICLNVKNTSIHVWDLTLLFQIRGDSWIPCQKPRSSWDLPFSIGNHWPEDDKPKCVCASGQCGCSLTPEESALTGPKHLSCQRDWFRNGHVWCKFYQESLKGWVSLRLEWHKGKGQSFFSSGSCHVWIHGTIKAIFQP